MTDREQIRTNIKRQLNSYRDLRAEHRQLTAEIRRLESLIGAPGNSTGDGMPRGSAVSNPVERAALKLLALKERYEVQLEGLADAQAVIEDLLEGLDTAERRLARFRYIDGLTWEKVCDKMSYSWRQTHRIHSRMLDKLVAAELERRKAEK